MDYCIKLQNTDKKKIYVDPQETEGIFLYPSEIKREGIEEDCLIDEKRFEQIRKEYAIKRAKKRAIALLSKKDMTEHELKDKLISSLNDAISIDVAISFMKDMGYIDDYRYVKDYISSKRHRKSFRVMKQELKKKGIASDVLDLIIEENDGQDISDILPLMRKYMRRFDEINDLSKQKTYAHFYRKGYTPDLVKRAYEHCCAEISDAIIKVDMGR